MALIALVSIDGVQAEGAGDESPVPRGERLRDIAPADGSFPIYIGAASNARLLDSISGEILDREFGYVTPGNDFKQSAIHPQPGKWKWSRADMWIKRCAANKQIMRLHAAISPQCSTWAKSDERTAEELAKNLDEYVTALCKRYNGNKHVRWLDVVNETVTRKGEWFGPREGNERWENPWTLIGFDESHPLRPPLYIKRAFELANRHAPDIKQIVNQHGNMEPAMWKKIKALVVYLRDSGIRVDGIGWQAHIDVGWEKDPQNVRQLNDLIAWTHGLGLEFHVTEANVWLSKGRETDFAAQGRTFAAILGILIDHSKEGTVTWNAWQIRDNETERGHLQGCLFTPEGEPKEAYYAVQSLLKASRPTPPADQAKP